LFLDILQKIGFPSEPLSCPASDRLYRSILVVIMNTLRFRWLILLVALVTTAVTLPARQSQEGASDSSQTTKSGIYPLPIIFYMPETGTAIGAAALYVYRNPDILRASTITGDVIYTAKKQIIIELDADLYFSRGIYRLLTYLNFQKFPNKFFGIGNSTSESDEENYTPRTYYLNGVLYRKVFSYINAGPAIRFEEVTMKDTDPAGKLVSGMIPGSRGGTLVGVGFVGNWDSRDNTIAAQSGSLYQLTALFYRRALGSDFKFSDVQIDTRNFFEIVPGQILAIQAAGEFIDGIAPFHHLARFGGSSLLRGYYDGRYRDNQGVALQAEYRVPVWWRFGAVGFVGAAQVADKISRLALNRFWLAGGVGLRFAWSPEERVNIRLDYGVGNNSSGMYITVTEAF
jgi:hypothetical protein